ncbi:MAG: hypothetical protein ACRCTD_09715 [Beijerinckiaceae bacterium]
MYQTARVVLFDANPQARRVTKDCLHKMRVQTIHEIQTPDEFNRWLNSPNADIMIFDGFNLRSKTDSVMAALEQAKTNASCSMALMLVTAEDRESRLKQMIAAGIEAIVLKPFSSMVLCDHFSHVMRNHVMRKRDEISAAPPPAAPPVQQAA